MATTSKKEVVRLLAAEHGLKRASELAEVDYAVARQWSVRGKWKAKPSVSQTVTRAADNITEEIQHNGQQTRLSLSRASLRLARGQEHTGTPKETLQTAQGAAIIHGWKDREEKESGLTLNILNVNQVVSPQ